LLPHDAPYPDTNDHPPPVGELLNSLLVGICHHGWGRVAINDLAGDAG